MKIRDFAVFIISYKRAHLLKKNTLRMLKNIGCKRPVYIIISDDDPTIKTYKRLYGDDKVIVFNKDKAHELQQTDLGDVYPKMKGCGSFARNYVFEAAKLKGYRYFLSLDDDYIDLTVRGKMGESLNNYKLRNIKYENFFDEMCELWFRMLDSQPYIICSALSQLGDYIGGLLSGIYRYGFKFKAMNAFFCDTEKEYRYPGRYNDDVNGYITNNIRGRISLTINGFAISPALTQNISGGMSDVYNQNGTYLKSIYSSMMVPSVAKISPMGETHYRIHHAIKYRFGVPKIINEKFMLNYYKPVIPELMFYLKKDKKFSDMKISFSKEDAQLKSNIELW